MKKLISALSVLLCLISCKKEAATFRPGNDKYLTIVLSRLRDSLSSAEFQTLDTNSTYLTDPGKRNNLTLRIGLKGKSIAGDFILVRTDKTGNIQAGTSVHLENTTPAYSYQFSGSVRLRSLSGNTTLQSEIVAGHILSFHAGNRLTPSSSGTKETTLLPAPDADWLPEVIVVGYSGSATSTPYISLDALLGGIGTGDTGPASGGSPDNSNPGDGGGNGGGNTGDGGSPPPAPSYATYSPIDPPASSNPIHHSFGPTTITGDIDVETEYLDKIPVIDIRKFFTCFDQVPSDGAVYSVQLCVDLPINNNPAASMNFSDASAGHTFLIVTKSNADISIAQIFGFYPATKPSFLSPFATLSAVIKNNGGQEINGSINMNISADQFNIMRTNAINLSTRPYALDMSNCTDYALGVFNSVRSSPITIDPYIVRVPGTYISGAPASPSYSVTIPNSPQGLFEKLNQLKSSQGPESANIQIDLSHNYLAPLSHGPCN
jgi:hypothetical protein